MIMLIIALICGLKGAGSASAARGSSGCCSCCCARLGACSAGIATNAASAADAISGNTNFRMVSPFICLSPRWVRRRLYSDRADDHPHQHQHDQPMAAVDQHQPPVAVSEAVVDQHGRDHEAEPQEQSGDD